MKKIETDFCEPKIIGDFLFRTGKGLFIKDKRTSFLISFRLLIESQKELLIEYSRVFFKKIKINFEGKAQRTSRHFF